MFTPSITVTATEAAAPPRRESFNIEVRGRFGGGYSAPGVSREKAIEMLARDARRYDCHKEPIVIVAPDDIKAAAGL